MKELFKILFPSFLAITILIVWFAESRSFYCIGDGRCVTVWKQIGGTCVVVPRKYYGLTTPSDNYILTTNTSDLDIIWDENPSTIIVSKDDRSKIINNSKDQIVIKDYKLNKAHYDSLYVHLDGHYYKYNEGVIYLSLFVEENWAVDYKGNKY